MNDESKARTTKKPKRPKRQFDEQFRRDAVALIASTGEPLAKLAAQLGVTHWNLRDWLKRYRPKGAGAPATPAEELRALVLRLQKENDELRSQRDVLKKPWASLPHQSGALRADATVAKRARPAHAVRRVRRLQQRLLPLAGRPAEPARG